MATIAQLYADRLYIDIKGSERSVHLADFPKNDPAMSDKVLEGRMAMAQAITSMALALRRKVNIKVRQPLSTLMIPAVDEAQASNLEAIKALVAGEVNVKEVKIVDGGAGILVKRVKPDFKKLGPRHGKNMKAVAAAISQLEQADIAALERQGNLELTLADGTKAVLDLADVEVFSEDIPGWLVANDGTLTIALDVTVSDELRREGIARDLVNRIQNIRKSRNYEITDRIRLIIEPNSLTDDAVSSHREYIASQVLAESVETATVESVAEDCVLDIDGVNVNVEIDVIK
ncbi:MAG: isoleucine--tRNA ligase, partial [Muribaculaceae bacterium]|nr:isoleucine--tRNA ligase [Muribaculaceae bacterium]